MFFVTGTSSSSSSSESVSESDASLIAVSSSDVSFSAKKNLLFTISVNQRIRRDSLHSLGSLAVGGLSFSSVDRRSCRSAARSCSFFL